LRRRQAEAQQRQHARLKRHGRLGSPGPVTRCLG
ncbi:hypothetical protein BN1708_019032, partial [Verticillium longisporum]